MKRVSALVVACLTAALLAACGEGKSVPDGSLSAGASSLRESPSFADAMGKQKVLHSFAGGSMDGSAPISGLVRIGELFYGTTGAGGSSDKGTVFSISPSGQFTVLYSFTGKADGKGSPAGLINVGGNLYGTTEDGGTAGLGTVFSITPNGAFTTLYSFKGGRTDGARPTAMLTNLNGKLYGTTAAGGEGESNANFGTFFSISTKGQEKVLYVFGSKKDDGLAPISPVVFQGGKFYGTTPNGGKGGAFGAGTIFSVTSAGQETVLYRFKDADDGTCGYCYVTNLGGTFYGTASTGGKNRVGSVFSITPAGAFKTLYSASTKNNAGGFPRAALTSVGGTLYGTMSLGPSGKEGTVFSITTDGALTSLYTFTGGNNGANPFSSLLHLGGKLFGSTGKGGTNNNGTIYSISDI